MLRGRAGASRRHRGVSLARAVSKITLVNVVIFVGGFLTGPIVARALGPSGRGQLAAIIAPLAFIPIVLGLGLGAFAAREVAAGRTLRVVLGALLPVSIALGLAGAAGGWFVADVLSDGNSTIRTFLRLGFLLAPVSLVVVGLQSVLAGQQRWNRLLLARAIPTVLAIVAVPTLYALGALTVATAAIVTIVGGVASAIPALKLLRGGRSFEWDRRYAAQAVSFGARAWAGGVANMANLRLDQVVMITLTTDSQLGLYAVAVTIASAPTVLPAAVAGPLQARVAAGDRGIVARTTRTTIALVVLVHVVAGALAVPVVKLLFGPGFSGSIVMVWILLAAGVPFAAKMLLSTVLSADGVPGRTAVAEFLALGLTVGLLLALVPEHGGMGAAVTSAVAYTASFAVLARAAVKRNLAPGFRDLLIPQGEDVRWMLATARGWLRRLRHRRSEPA